MVLSVPVIALGATLGTATSILALCGVTCLCRHMHPKKGLLQRDRDPDPEKARPGVLRAAQQVSGARPRLGARGRGGGGPSRFALSDRAWRGAGRANVLQGPSGVRKAGAGGLGDKRGKRMARAKGEQMGQWER